MSDYNLSVIIPTKNRAEYCRKVLRQIIAATTDATEIVVQDNSDTDELRQFAQEAGCGRIVYNHDDRLLSFVDNFSAAVSLAHGKYMCMIGDDDAVLPEIERAAAFAGERDLDAVIPELNAVYLWPDEHPIVKGGEDGYLVLSYVEAGISPANTSESLEKLLKNGMQDYQSFDVPRLYHGIVHRRVLEKIKEKTGAYFGGLTPDIYMAVALACLCGRVGKLRFPITVSGICPSSGSAASATGAHTGELRDAPHFRGHNGYAWDAIIPQVYTVETIWAETGLHAIDDFAGAEMRGKFDLSVLCARLWMKYPQFRTRILEHGKASGLSEEEIKRKAFRYKLSSVVKRLTRRLKRRPGEVIKLYDLTDISAAAEKTEALIEKKKITWD